MKRPSDEDLILHYYGESPDAASLDAALEDPDTAERWRRLRAVLDAVPDRVEAPEPPTDFEERVWRRVSDRLEPRGSLLPFPLSPAALRWAAAAGLAAALGAAFWLGGRVGTPAGPQSATQGDAEEEPRVLLLAVADHLDRTEMLLAELTNRGDGASTTIDREWARELSTSGRLYRQAAQGSGAGDLALLLSELEPILVELANGPEALSDDELDDLMARGDVLFKVRVVGSRLKNENYSGAAGADV